MKPYVICHMATSLDGRIVVERWSRCPDASADDYVAVYFDLLEQLATRGYIVGRVTMEPYATGTTRAPKPGDAAIRPLFIAQPDALSLAVVLDPSGKLHWEEGNLDGEHLVMVLGPDVSDAHLCELAERGVSYIVCESARIEPAKLLDMLSRTFGVEKITVAGGGVVNGSFMTAGMVDELSLVLVPSLDGTTGAPSIADAGAAGLAGKMELRFLSVVPVKGGALHLRYAVQPVKAAL